MIEKSKTLPPVPRAHFTSSFRDPWISLERQLNNGSVRKYFGMGRAEPAYISNPYSIYTGSRIRVFGLCVYTRPSTCPSRRTTLNLPWIRARTERGRTGQFSIQVGQSRSSVSCTRLTLIFPISSSSFSSVFQPLRS